MENIIKFTCDWIEQEIEIVSEQDLEALNRWRSRLITMNLIGALPNGIGFGNISYRVDDISFVITGSQTGHIADLTKENLSLVSEYNIHKNYLKCYGKTRASSESLSHAAFYLSNSKITAVIHIHDKKTWAQNLNRVPTTSCSALYGSSELAESIMHLLSSEGYHPSVPIIMGGHPEGIILGGFSLDDAGKNILRFYNKIRSKNETR